jgi:DUF2933 family protein
MATLTRTRLIWIVLGLVAVLGVGAWIAAPRTVLSALPFLLLAACPLSMVFMMGSMGHGGHGAHSAHDHDMSTMSTIDAVAHGDPALAPQDRLRMLKARLGTVEAEQAHIARQLADLEATQLPETPHARSR